MNILTLHPYGSIREEGGLALVLSRYLREFGVDTSHLKCNGAFSVCDRDAENHFRRTALQCQNCMAEQNTFAQWSGARQLRITSYLEPAQIQGTKRWVEQMDAHHLWEAVWKGIPLRTLLQGSFSRRFGTLEPDFRNVQHQHYVQKLSVASLRMLTAALKCNEDIQPNMIFMAGGDEFITACFFAAAQRMGIEVVRFTSAAEGRFVRVLRSSVDETFKSELVVSDISAFRENVQTWPSELLQSLDEMVAYLGLSQLQLELPLAR